MKIEKAKLTKKCPMCGKPSEWDDDPCRKCYNKAMREMEKSMR